jgi:hypothetical protein
MTMINSRAWDELRAASSELSKRHCIDSSMLAVIGEVARRFEVPQSPEAEAVDVFLTGLLDALGAAA